MAVELELEGEPAEVYCPKCGKIVYRTRAAAMAALRVHNRRKRVALSRAYWSEDCKAWHLTRRRS